MDFDSTFAGEFANSYVEVDEAVDLLESLGFFDLPWCEADTGMQEYTLVVAASLLGMLPLRGERVYPVATEEYEPQAMDFPRTCQYDPDIIPDGVKEAQSILAATVVYQNVQNLLSQFTGSGGDAYLLENLIQSGAIESVTVGGVFSVKLASPSSSSLIVSNSMSNLGAVPTIFGLPVYMRMKPYLTQIRGGVIE